MPPVGRETPVHAKFRNLLHEFKVELFRQEHDKRSLEEVTSECLAISDEVLKQNYHYHFHKLPDANRAEIINMINNYTREAVLPPVVEKLVKRQVLLEHRFDAMVKLLERTLEHLSNETPAGAPTR